MIDLWASLGRICLKVARRSIDVSTRMVRDAFSANKDKLFHPIVRVCSHGNAQNTELSIASFDTLVWQYSCLVHSNRYMPDSITRRAVSHSTKGVLPWFVNDAVDLKYMIISAAPLITLRGNVWALVV